MKGEDPLPGEARGGLKDQGFRVSGFQGFRVSGFQSFRVSGFRSFENKSLRYEN